MAAFSCRLKRLPLAAMVAALWAPCSRGVELASPFTSHAVLQRDVPLPVWGMAEPGEHIRVTIATQTKLANAGEDGTWRVTLDPLPVSKRPLRLVVRGAEDDPPVEIDDLAVGDVWLMVGARIIEPAPPPPDAPAESPPPVAAPTVRLFVVAPARAYEPQAIVDGAWEAYADAASPAPCAAAFAAALRAHVGATPVGVIVLPPSGSTQSWMRRAAISANPNFRPPLDAFDARAKAYVAPTEEDFRHWQETAAKKKPPPRNRKKGSRAVVFHPPTDPIQAPDSPTVAFNGMIAPLLPYPIRGVAWRPEGGRSPVTDLARQWDRLLIEDWRALWGRDQTPAAAAGAPPVAMADAPPEPNGADTPALPFLFAQFPKVRDVDALHAMESAAARLPATGEVVTMDLGATEPDVAAERTIGERFARLAAAIAYRRSIESSGPQLARIDSYGAALQLHFTHAAGGLVVHGETLDTLEVAGNDGAFQRADAHIDGGSIYVSSPDVAVPTRVRYAWGESQPGEGFLYNASGLPAAPFEAGLAEK